ncbi:hypothetical protein PAMC26510_00340 [Caballeronia sordidicola]|uniref:Uncharacterized protein n=1 Tax=Caballeronia sordidicola TaxID=196367 RepID=A0A242NAK3_CABSO|nr:hypothetical protein PAMC26510_00340 [Caballeronia sordidicola]
MGLSVEVDTSANAARTASITRRLAGVSVSEVTGIAYPQKVSEALPLTHPAGFP